MELGITFLLGASTIVLGVILAAVLVLVLTSALRAICEDIPEFLDKFEKAAGYFNRKHKE